MSNGQPKLSARLWAAAGAIALLLAAGCGHTEVDFVLNREGQKPLKQLPADQQDARAVSDVAITYLLQTMFGTPDAPAAWGGTAVSGLDEKRLRLAAGPADDPQGRGLFRKHCVHCHGVSGDGNGPTARFLNPYPRDFRWGKFKFKSTAPAEAMPTREDLQRTVREGINGTAMPSFKVLLRGDEIEALAEYVVYLSMRGQIELKLRNPENDTGIVDDNNIRTENDLTLDNYENGLLANLRTDPRLDAVLAEAKKMAPDKAAQPDVKNLLAEMNVPSPFVQWRRVETAFQRLQTTNQGNVKAYEEEQADLVKELARVEKDIEDARNAKARDEKKLAELNVREIILTRRLEAFIFIPPQRDAAMEKLVAQQNGQQLFTVKANCIKCHGPNGLGDGGQLDFDSWNKPKDDQRRLGNLTPGQLAERFNLPLQRSQPRNLRLGIYRGGRRPVDIYRRIALGINGTPMPAHMAKDAGDAKNLQPHEIWALVDYVRSLPYRESGELQHATVAEGPRMEGQ